MHRCMMFYVFYQNHYMFSPVVQNFCAPKLMYYLILIYLIYCICHLLLCWVWNATCPIASPLKIRSLLMMHSALHFSVDSFQISDSEGVQENW